MNLPLQHSASTMATRQPSKDEVTKTLTSLDDFEINHTFYLDIPLNLSYRDSGAIVVIILLKSMSLLRSINIEQCFRDIEQQIFSNLTDFL